MDLNDPTDLRPAIDPNKSAVTAEAPANGEAAGGNGQRNGHGFGLHQLLHALQAMRIGDFSVRLPSDQTGLEGKIADTFNEIVAGNERTVVELAHVGQVVGREGKTRTRVKFGPAERFVVGDEVVGQ